MRNEWWIITLLLALVYLRPGWLLILPYPFIQCPGIVGCSGTVYPPPLCHVCPLSFPELDTLFSFGTRAVITVITDCTIGVTPPCLRRSTI